MAHVELVRGPNYLRPWWKDPAEIHLLFVWLVDNGRIRTLDEAAYYLEKPKKWNPEREEMLREEEMQHLAEEAAREREDRYFGGGGDAAA